MEMAARFNWLTVLLDAKLYQKLARISYWVFVSILAIVVAIYFANFFINGNTADKCKANKNVMMKIDKKDYCVKSKYRIHSINGTNGRA